MPQNQKSNKRHVLSTFADAARGIRQLFKTERNIWIHLCFTLAVIALGFVFNLSSAEWTAVVLSCGLVLGAEAMNTAIEYLANHITTERNEQIRKVKDVAAGAVLLCALAALSVGLIVFLPKVLQLLGL